MNIEKKYRWALTGLIIMILINAVTLVSVWVYHPDGNDWRKYRNNDKERGSIQQYMKDQLGLTDEQADTIVKLRKDHYQEIRSFRDSLEKGRRAYIDFIMSEEARDQSKRDSILTILTDQYENIEGSLYNHMIEINDLLDREQQVRFQEMILNTYTKGHDKSRTHKSNDR